MDYFKRVFPDPFQILGLKLKPLSLGRYRLLHRFQCAFVADEAKGATLSDLLIGVLVCSMRVNEFLQWADSARFSKDITKWRKRIFKHAWIGRIPWIGKWWRKNHAPNVVAKIGLLKAYIENGVEIPQFWDIAGGEQSNSSHWSHGIEITLRSELGWTEEEINEQPISKAIADFFRLLEGRGQIRIIQPEELERAKTNEQIILAAMAAGKKEGRVMRGT